MAAVLRFPSDVSAKVEALESNYAISFSGNPRIIGVAVVQWAGASREAFDIGYI